MAVKVEVAYATPKKQVIIALEIPAVSAVNAAIERSGILQQFPTIDLTRQPVGIFSKKVKLTDLLHENDRVEIYRPLLIDPKQARLLRAKKIYQKIKVDSDPKC